MIIPAPMGPQQSRARLHGMQEGAEPLRCPCSAPGQQGSALPQPPGLSLCHTEGSPQRHDLRVPTAASSHLALFPPGTEEGKHFPNSSIRASIAQHNLSGLPRAPGQARKAQSSAQPPARPASTAPGGPGLDRCSAPALLGQRMQKAEVCCMHRFPFMALQQPGR